jgi:hypothetical protein
MNINEPQLLITRALTGGNFLSLITGGLVGVFGVMPGARASTIVLPDATYTASLAGGDGFGHGYHQDFSSTSPATYAIGGSRAELTATPSPSAHASVSAAGSAASTASATVTYFFAITGPTTGVSVPLEVSTFVQYEITGAQTGNPATAFQADASVSVFAEARQIAQVFSFSFSSSTPNNTFSGVLDAQAVTGNVNKIVVAALADANNSQVGIASTSVDAFADPVISFAPGFDSTGFSIVLSPGVGNDLHVPEGGSFCLMAASLGMLVWRPKRR